MVVWEREWSSSSESDSKSESESVDEVLEVEMEDVSEAEWMREVFLSAWALSSVAMWSWSWE